MKFFSQKIAVYIRSGIEVETSDYGQLSCINNYINTNFPNGEVTVFRDGFSSRESFFSLKNRLEESYFNFLICSRLDRLDTLADSVENTFEFICALERRNVSLICLFEGIDTRKYGNGFISSVVNGVKKSKSYLRKERVRIALSATQHSGISHGRPKSVDRVKVFALRAQNKSIRAIAHEMSISPTTVQSILKNSELPPKDAPRN